MKIGIRLKIGTNTRFPIAIHVAFCSIVISAFAQAVEPLMVTQGRASQKAGTRLVDVNYDLSGGVPPYSVTLQGSMDGGVTWTLPVASVSGHVGTVSTAGTNRLITWDAGADWNGQVSANVKFRVNVTDSATPPPPAGFSLIPAGWFEMGQDGIATPVHSVYVSTFYLAKYETTKELWDSVRAWGAGRGYPDLAVGNGSYPSKGANHPVHSITWYDMVKWCNARSEMENLVPCYYTDAAQTLIYKTGYVNIDNTMVNWNANGYRLPTEAEWEKAARGGVAGKLFPWGTDTITHSQANYGVYSSNGTTNYFSYDVTPRPPATGNYFYHPSYTAGGYPYSSPVGSFAPNGYGLYDMAGNMWEWCWDRYASYPSTSQTDPRGPASGSFRVSRGGSWNNDASDCRVAYRDYGGPGGAGYYFGFRIARSSVPYVILLEDDFDSETSFSAKPNADQMGVLAPAGYTLTSVYNDSLVARRGHGNLELGFDGASSTVFSRVFVNADYITYANNHNSPINFYFDYNAENVAWVGFVIGTTTGGNFSQNGAWPDGPATSTVYSAIFDTTGGFQSFLDGNLLPLADFAVPQTIKVELSSSSGNGSAFNGNGSVLKIWAGTALLASHNLQQLDRINGNLAFAAYHTDGGAGGIIDNFRITADPLGN